MDRSGSSTRARTRTGARAAVVATLALLGGCSGAGDQSTDATGADEVGALTAYLDKVGGAYDEASAREQARRSEEIIARCMADEGFEYTPRVTYGQDATSPDDDLPAWDSLEFAQFHGYGITTFDDLPGATDPTGVVDPDQEYLDAMSEAEREAYDLALSGTAVEPDPDDPDAVGDWTTGGCQGEAMHAIDEQEEAWVDEDFVALQDERIALYETLATDPEVVAAGGRWSDCMADAGYVYETPGDAATSIIEASNRLLQSGQSTTAKVGELRDLEIATAVADVTCQDEVGYADARETVRLRLEQEFVDTHRAELDAWVAKYAPATEAPSDQ